VTESGRAHPDDLGIPPPEGVHAIEHTADVGLAIEAESLVALLRRAALGMAWLLLERVPVGVRETRQILVRGDDPPALLRELLRELLWWHERDSWTITDLKTARVERGESGLVLEAVGHGVAEAGQPVREIKGVTLHGLAAEQTSGGWRGRVIFDV
jgi:SHS2 domain-containing protein